MKNKLIEVLDKGYVRLVDHMGSDLSIVRAARVSFDADWRAGESESADEKLINYLIKNRHSTPFEAVVFTFEVKAPIFVFRQWHRHRTQSYSEVSGRYMELTEFHTPEVGTIAGQSKSNKQGRLDEPMESELAGSVQKFIHGQHVLAFKSYRELLDTGVAREVAREVLPVATYSRMFATMNLWNLMHFMSLRMHPHAQYEIRVYAEAIYDLIFNKVPVTMKAWVGLEEAKRSVRCVIGELINMLDERVEAEDKDAQAVIDRASLVLKALP